jgi:P27 family predicted phage terminase small subunit
MGQGRKSLPNEIKEANGTLRKCRIKTDLIKPSIELNAEPPSELNEWGAQIYRAIMSEYSKIGLISKVDVGSLLILCNEFGTYCEADDIIKAKGLEIEEDVYSVKGELTGTRTVPNPMLKVRNDAMKNYKTLCVEFGLTPASRAGLNAPPEKTNKPFSEFD